MAERLDVRRMLLRRGWTEDSALGPLRKNGALWAVANDSGDFDEETALRLADEVAPTVTVNGYTVAALEQLGRGDPPNEDWRAARTAIERTDK